MIKDEKQLENIQDAIEDEWIASTPEGYYNCSSEANKYFAFLDDSQGLGKVINKSHAVYRQRKRDELLSRSFIS